MNLPRCEYRSEIAGTRMFHCDHPLVIVSEDIVTHPICRTCSLAGERSSHLQKRSRSRVRNKSLLPIDSIAVVIPCHNYGRYLADAIDSVLAQTVVPDEILVIVDRSTDDSMAVAQSYENRRVRTLVVDFGNVHSVRRKGFQETAADVLCFLDADDRISEDYLETGLRQFQSCDVGVVYSDLYHFGSQKRLQQFPEEFCRDELNRRNFIHAGSLVRRDALELSNAFDLDLDATTASCTGDWWLWRCVVNHGWSARKQSGRYHYRRHPESALATRAKKISYYRSAWLKHELLTLFIPLSGRHQLWGKLSRFLESQLWPHHQVQLIFLDTSQDDQFSQTVRRWIATSDYADIRHIKENFAQPHLADWSRTRHVTDVRKAMAKIYNRLKVELVTPFVWILEDDIVPPLDVAQRLLEAFDESTGSVAAPYRSRFHSGYVVWRGETATVMKAEQGVTEVAGNGFGCTIVRSELIRKTSFSHAYRLPDFDHAFYAILRSKGLKARVCWDVECQHFNSDGREASQKLLLDERVSRREEQR